MKINKCFLAVASSILLFSVVCFLPLNMQARAAFNEQNFLTNSTAISKPTITTKAQFTSAESIVVSGAAVAGDTVTITGGAENATGTANNGSYSIVVQLQQNVVNTLKVTAADADGNVSSSATVLITQDSIAPAAPTITTYPQSIKATSIIVTGVAEAGSTVTISGGSAVATGTASGSGAYSITVKLNSNVSNTLSVTATDKAGNVSSPSFIVAVQDSIAPAVPTIITSSQTTTYTSIDVSGTAEALSTVTITNGSVKTTGMAFNGIYSIAVSLNENAVNTLKVTATDMAGNVSTAATVIITQKSDSSQPDTVAPAKPTIATKAQITSATSITVTGTAEADSTVNISGGYGDGTVIGTASDSGSYSIAVKLWSDTVNTLSVTATDAAGNVSGATTVKITQDSTAPATPTIATLAAVTSSTSITVTGAAEAGSTVKITGGLGTVTGIATTSGSYSIIEKLNPNAVNTLMMTATDTAGNVSAAATISITQEDVPAMPTITTQEQNTTSASITVTGTAKPGYIVTIIGGSARATATVGNNGSYSINVSLNIGVENTLYVMATDASGIISNAATVNIMQGSASTTPALISYTMTADSKFIATGTKKSFNVYVSRDDGSEVLTDGKIMIVTTLATGNQSVTFYSLNGDMTTQNVIVDASSVKCSVYLINGNFDGTAIPTTYALAVLITK